MNRYLIAATNPNKERKCKKKIYRIDNKERKRKKKSTDLISKAIVIQPYIN